MPVWSMGLEDPQRREWQSTPVFLPGESHGQRSLVGYTVHRFAPSLTWLKQLCISTLTFADSEMALVVKNPPAMQETQVRSLGWEDPLEKRMATHSSILAWRIPWTEEPDRLWSIGFQRVRHDWSDLASTHSCCMEKQRACDALNALLGFAREEDSTLQGIPGVQMSM